MKRKRVTGLILMLLIIATNSMIVLAKTDSASRNFKCTGVDISGRANVSISTGFGYVNKAKSSGSISGSDLGISSSSYYYTQVKLYMGSSTKSYKMYNGKPEGSTSMTKYNKWDSTMKVFFNGKKLVAWTVCCA